MTRDRQRPQETLGEALSRSAETMDARAKAEVRKRVLAEARRNRRGFLVTLPQRLAAGITAATLLTGGAAYALGQAMPGDALYPLKLATENALIALLPPGELEHRVLLGVAARRAEEASRLGAAGEDEAAGETLRELERAVERVSGPEGTLSEEEAARIRENIEESPGPTGDAIDQIVPAPTQQQGPQQEPQQQQNEGGEAPAGSPTQGGGTPSQETSGATQGNFSQGPGN